MTNAQLAAARRVNSAFPLIRFVKSGSTLVPRLGAISGAQIEITEGMSPQDVQGLLTEACEELMAQ